MSRWMLLPYNGRRESCSPQHTDDPHLNHEPEPLDLSCVRNTENPEVEQTRQRAPTRTERSPPDTEEKRPSVQGANVVQPDSTDTDPLPRNEVQQTGSGSTSDPGRSSPDSRSSGSGSGTELQTVSNLHKQKAHKCFSNEQMKALGKRFSVQKYLAPDQTKELAQRIGLTHKQVRTWFQNRRMLVKRNQNRSRRESERNGSGRVRPAGGFVPSHVQPYQGHAHPLLQHMMGAAVQKTASQNRFAVGSGGVNSGYPMMSVVNGVPAVHPNGFGIHGASSGYSMVSGVPGGPAVYPTGFSVHRAPTGYLMMSGFQGAPAVLHSGSRGGPDDSASSSGPNWAAVPERTQASGLPMPPGTNHDEDEPIDFYSACRHNYR